MNVPRVVIGVPLYNHADDLPEALESLLNQSCREFRLVCVDDQSTDGTADMVRRYAAQDDRIVYTRNPARLGMIDNWRRVFDLALEYAPEAEYFAWASDHDIWEPGWLTTLTEVLDRHPRVVLAYPRNRRIEPDGTLYTRRPWEFDTAGVDDWRVRFKRTMRHMSAGNMVYGLGRVDAIRRAGVFRRVLVPDRLLMMELALEGQFHQAPEVLWFRRVYGHAFSLQRQYRAFFSARSAALHIRSLVDRSRGRAHLVARRPCRTGAGDRPLGRVPSGGSLSVDGRPDVPPAGTDQYPTSGQAAPILVRSGSLAVRQDPPGPLALLQDQTQGLPEMAPDARPQVAAPPAISFTG